MKTKVSVSQDMLKGAKAAYVHYSVLPCGLMDEQFKILEQVIEELFGEQEPSDSWKEYSRQYQEYVKSEE